MGNFIKEITERTSLIASDKLWVEDSAIQQLKTTANLPGMHSVVGLPDIHPGRGYPVGAAFFSVGCMYPALVGNDIGCGAALWQTNLSLSKVKLDKLDRQIGNLDALVSDAEWLELFDLFPDLSYQYEEVMGMLSREGLNISHMRSVGTIGRGNHFAEVQSIDQVVDSELFEATGMQKKTLQLLIHSGSRGLGQEILRAHVDEFGHAGLSDNTQAAKDYLRKHDIALEFASLNRSTIAARILRRIRCDSTLILDVHHNTVLPAKFGDLAGWIHRKGANPSDQGLVMLPGSRDDFSYLIHPNASADDLSLKSLPHGAGRKWQRTDCKDRLYHVSSPSEFTKTSFGGRVICGDKALIYEEASQAYKSVDSVLDCLLGANLVTVVSRSKPILTYKTRGECC